MAIISAKFEELHTQKKLSTVKLANRTLTMQIYFSDLPDSFYWRRSFCMIVYDFLYQRMAFCNDLWWFGTMYDCLYQCMAFSNSVWLFTSQCMAFCYNVWLFESLYGL